MTPGREESAAKLISRSDEELVSTIALMSQATSKEQKIRESLQQQYAAHPEQVEVGLSLGLFELLILMRRGNLADERNANQAIEILDHVLAVAPENWLVRVLKVTLMLMLSDMYRIEHSILKDIDQLFTQQQGAEPHSYFITPYILCAHYYYLNDALKTAVEALDRGLKEVPHEPVRVLGNLLSLPLLNLFSRVADWDSAELRASLSQLRRVYFPHLKTGQAGGASLA